MKADKVTVDADIATINSRVTEINGDIVNLNAKVTNVKKLIAEEIDTKSLSATWVDSLFTIANTIKAKGSITGSTIRATSMMYISNFPVATQAYVNTMLAEICSKSWVQEQGYLTQITNDVLPSYMRVSNLSVSASLYFEGYTVATRKWVLEQLAAYAKADHAHSWPDITGKPASFKAAPHTHSFAGNAVLGWGHTHVTSSSFAAGKNTGGVSGYASKTISIKGTTGSNS